MSDAVVLLGHGSRDPAGNAPLVDLAAEVGARLPGVAVSVGYVELAAPLLDDALTAAAGQAAADGGLAGHRTQRVADAAGRSEGGAGDRRVVVVPLFLFAAGHVKNDLPLALARARERHPGVRFAASPPLAATAELIATARVEARVDGDPANTALIVAGRGSSDPDANAELYRVARLIAEGDPWMCVLPCFAGVASPDLPAALELAARARPRRIAVVPYLLFPGRVLTRLGEQLAAFAARTPWVPARLGAPLGGAAIVDAVVDRAAGVFGGARELACDTCQYRVPIAGAVDRVGGLRALLWSVRHQLTHGQAAPHVHAHRPIDKHVLVCSNIDCAARGSVELVTALRRGLKEAGRDRTVRVTRTACMGRCGEGPTVAVYPDGVWYRGVRASDADELIREHLIGDRLVARLIDSVFS